MNLPPLLVADLKRINRRLLSNKLDLVKEKIFSYFLDSKNRDNKQMKLLLVDKQQEYYLNVYHPNLKNEK